MKLIVKFLIPFVFIRFAFNTIAKIRFSVSIGRKSLVRGGCHFGGNNIIMTNSEVSYSRLGRHSYIANHSVLRYADIGAFCSIGDHVRTCLGMHPVSFFSTHPQTYSENPPSGHSWVTELLFKEHQFIEQNEKYVVEIGSDVWIGNNVLIMDGITIGHGAIIAAGSVVTKDVEPYAIVAGVPAKLLKKRFDEDKILRLLELRWWDKSDEWIRDNFDFLRSI